MFKRGFDGILPRMLQVRRALADDISGIRETLSAAYAPFVKALPDLPDVSAVDESDLANMTCWVAEDEDGVVAVAMATQSGQVAHLANLAVKPTSGGQGLGRRMIDTVVQWAREARCREIALATHPDMGNNVALYEHLGWRIAESSDHKVTLVRRL